MSSIRSDVKGRAWAFTAVLSAVVLAGSIAAFGGGRGGLAGGGQNQLPTTGEDFFQPGTQERPASFDPMYPSWNCSGCHEFENDGNPDAVVAPHNSWVASMMAQATRDPIWKAALAVANQDAASSGESCIRCHSPLGWIGGRSVPPDGSALTTDDHDGVSCQFCHRLVNPEITVYSPLRDYGILRKLAKAGTLPDAPGNGRYVLDPVDTRRGPLFDVPMNVHGVPIMYSWVHQQSAVCATCHDVSNPVYTRQPDGSYVLNAYNAAHPTQDQHEMMPEQRTWSEWLHSRFAGDGVVFKDGRFGGPGHPTGTMRTCQDCHMPRFEGGACAFWDVPPFFLRPDVPQHSMAGGNTWVLRAVRSLYPDWESGLTEENVADAEQRTAELLRAASDVDVEQYGDRLVVRIVNYSGHKLPTGYPEGRRMWVNVKLFDVDEQLLEEYGEYDADTAVLSTGDTRVYEMKLGITEEVAQLTNLPAGESFHLVLNNEVLLDNRIPPIGFTNAAFESVRAEPVGHAYADGQYWDDSSFFIPAGTMRAEVTVYFQTTSKEYIEFLRDVNVTNNDGQIAYDQWVAHGRSAPVDMDFESFDVGPRLLGDLNRDHRVNFADALLIYAAWGPCPPPALCPEDLNRDGTVDFHDIKLLYNNMG